MRQYKTKRTALALIFAGLFSCAVQAQDTGTSNVRDAVVAKTYAPLKYQDSGSSFYDDRERGWHWYELPLEDEEAEPVLPPPPPTPEPPKEAEKKKEEPVVAKPSGPAPMSSDWLKENLPKYLSKAIDEPTDENVRAYLYLQRYAMDKAQGYAMASQRITLGDSYLDANARRPISNAGSTAADGEGYKLRKEILDDLKKTAGIMFFFRGDCQYCHTQWPLLQRFSQKYGFTVMPISVDGGLLPGMDPTKVQVDRGQAAKMGVTQVPTTFLMKPPNQFSVISHGVISPESMPEAIVQAASAAKIIDEKTFLATRGVRDKSIRAPMAGNTVTEEVLTNPESLVDYMKAKMKEGR